MNKQQAEQLCELVRQTFEVEGYEQGRRYLVQFCETSKENMCFCYIGGACRKIEGTRITQEKIEWDDDDNAVDGIEYGMEMTGYVSYYGFVKEIFGLSYEEVDRITKLNDAGASWQEINRLVMEMVRYE